MPSRPSTRIAWPACEGDGAGRPLALLVLALRFASRVWPCRVRRSRASLRRRQGPIPRQRALSRA
eukprot:2621590-Rhodomonas_salina.1